MNVLIFTSVLYSIFVPIIAPSGRPSPGDSLLSWKNPVSERIDRFDSTSPPFFSPRRSFPFQSTDDLNQSQSSTDPSASSSLINSSPNSGWKSPRPSAALPQCSCEYCDTQRAIQLSLNETESDTSSKAAEQDKPEMHSVEDNIRFVRDFSNNMTMLGKFKVIETIHYLLTQKNNQLDTADRAAIEYIFNERVKKDPEIIKALRIYNERNNVGDGQSN